LILVITFDLTLFFIFLVTDPQQWTSSHVQSWLQSTISQFKLQPIADMISVFPENGQELVHLTEEEFVQRSPQVGFKSQIAF
jgi:hypothetical protein